MKLSKANLKNQKWLFQAHWSSRLHAYCNQSTKRYWRCL